MPCILVIEDEQGIRQNLAEFLSLANYQVFTAANGKEGIEMANLKHPDLIISDIMMPLIDGFGVLHILRRATQTKDIPFIFLTAKSDIPSLKQAMSLGANDYIIKPFEGSELLDTVEKKLRSSSVQPTHTFAANETEEPDTFSTQPLKEALRELVDSGEVAEYSKKHVLFKEGSTPRFLYYMRKGKVKTYKSHEDGKELVMGLYGEDDFIGYLPLLKNSTQIETAEVTEDCEVVLISKSEFEKTLDRSQAVMKHFTTILAASLMEKEEQLLGAAYNTLRKKVAAALVTLGKKYSEKQNDYVIDMSRNELASIAGTATESLIRTLTEFKQEKLINIDNGVISMLNRDKLERLLR